MKRQDRLRHIRRFYRLMAELEKRLGGARRLRKCSGSMDWPRRGVYFFRESGETRKDSGSGPRIVRVGTHALKAGSKSTLWTRLRQHRGTLAGGGWSGGSVFRKHVGKALVSRDGHRPSARSLEIEASKVIGAMPFLWLAIEDGPGPDSRRGYIERNAIALLSNRRGQAHRSVLPIMAGPSLPA